MSDISKAELARLLNDEELGEQAYRLDVTSRWPSLRVLDYLFSEGRSTTGDIARGINMDMQEVRQTLDELNEIGVVEELKEGETTYWNPTMRELEISLTSDQGLDIEFTSDPSKHDPEREGRIHNISNGIFTKIGRRLDAMFLR